MSTIFQIEFFKNVEGRADVVERLDAPGEFKNVDAVSRYALTLPRPPGATGVRIRENGGPVRATVILER